MHISNCLFYFTYFARFPFFQDAPFFRFTLHVCGVSPFFIVWNVLLFYYLNDCLLIFEMFRSFGAFIIWNAFFWPLKRINFFSMNCYRLFIINDPPPPNLIISWTFLFQIIKKRRFLGQIILVHLGLKISRRRNIWTAKYIIWNELTWFNSDYTFIIPQIK